MADDNNKIYGSSLKVKGNWKRVTPEILCVVETLRDPINGLHFIPKYPGELRNSCSDKIIMVNIIMEKPVKITKKQMFNDEMKTSPRTVILL